MQYIHSRKHFHPIWLATVTTMLGLITLYSEGSKTWKPMVVAINAGLLCSLLFTTLLTLGIVPVSYILLFRERSTNKSR